MFKESYIITHRGIHDNINIYENTLEAFKLSIKKGYAIELDVRMTKDKQIVVFHDNNTKRLTKKDLIVEENTYQELNNQNILHIPLLIEVLELVKGKVPLLIEIKPTKKDYELAANLMTILNNYEGKYAIQSFNPKVLYWFRKNYPQILRGQLSMKYTEHKISSIKKYILSKMLFNKITKPNFISYKYNELNIEQIKKYKKQNIYVIGWTITNEKEYNHYKKYYDNLICNKSN